jgi:hypothetical protein
MGTDSWITAMGGNSPESIFPIGFILRDFINCEALITPIKPTSGNPISIQVIRSV